MQSDRFIIVFAGGGSGGHVYPMIAVIEALQKKATEMKFPMEMVRMGPHDGYEPLFQARGVALKPIAAGKMRRYFSLENILDIPKFFIGLLQALIKLYFIMPDIIFSKGGTGALPVVIAGWFYRIPVAIHESDAQPGLTNLTSSRFSKRIFVSFARAANYFSPKKTIVTGGPIRSELTPGKTTRELAKENLGFNATQPLVLILGGSQGSTRVNEFILKNLNELMKRTQVLHQTGVANFLDVQKLSRAALIDDSFKNRYQPVNYFDKNLDIALTAADVVISRAGSNSIFEIAAFGVPAILIPLSEAANNHQRINAYEFAKGGSAVVIEEPNLLPGIFLGELDKVLKDENLRAKMAAASKAFFIPEAAEKMADEILLLAAN